MRETRPIAIFLMSKHSLKRSERGRLDNYFCQFILKSARIFRQVFITRILK